jgi:hypothetical protein
MLGRIAMAGTAADHETDAGRRLASIALVGDREAAPSFGAAAA